MRQDGQGQNQGFAAIFVVIIVPELQSISGGKITSFPETVPSAMTHLAAEGVLPAEVHRFYSYVTQRNSEPGCVIGPVV